MREKVFPGIEIYAAQKLLSDYDGGLTCMGVIKDSNGREVAW